MRRSRLAPSVLGLRLRLGLHPLQPPLQHLQLVLLALPVKRPNLVLRAQPRVGLRASLLRGRDKRT